MSLFRPYTLIQTPTSSLDVATPPGGERRPGVPLSPKPCPQNPPSARRPWPRPPCEASWRTFSHGLSITPSEEWKISVQECQCRNVKYNTSPDHARFLSITYRHQIDSRTGHTRTICGQVFANKIKLLPSSLTNFISDIFVVLKLVAHQGFSWTINELSLFLVSRHVQLSWKRKSGCYWYGTCVSR